MPVSQAYILCPHAVFLPRITRTIHRFPTQIMDLLGSFGYRFLQVSIDEAFLDISPCSSYGAAAMLAVKTPGDDQIQVLPDLLSRIAPGKTVAKIASDY